MLLKKKQKYMLKRAVTYGLHEQLHVRIDETVACLLLGILFCIISY